jgi:hypothetical protein
MENSREKIHAIVQSLFVYATENLPAPQPIIVLLASLPEEIEQLDVSTEKVDGGVRWEVVALTKQLVAVVHGTVGPDGNSSDVLLNACPLSSLRSATVDRPQVVDMFHDWNTRVRWAFDIEGFAEPLVLDPAGVSFPARRDLIEAMAARLLGYLSLS